GGARRRAGPRPQVRRRPRASGMGRRRARRAACRVAPSSSSRLERYRPPAALRARRRPRSLCATSHTTAPRDRTMVGAMTAVRPTLSLPTHAALELLVGLLALVAPFALGFGLAGAVVSILAGVIVVGLALDAAQHPARVSAHQAFDYGIAFAAVLVAV